MEDEEITLTNACMDLVSLKKWESFPLRLLTGKAAGEWVCAREFCQQIGITTHDLTADLYATWLLDPKAQEGYVVILFYDAESQWSMAVHYNRARLLGATLPSIKALQPSEAAVPA